MFSVIMAGGSGTRFWPASRENLPKQFLRITSSETMFSETIARVRRFSQTADIYAVVGNAHQPLVRKSCDLADDQILVEPRGRNTAACIGLAALHIARRDADAPIVVLPADHFVADAEGFARLVAAASASALEGQIATLGITPTRPETGYGYIRILTDSEAHSPSGRYRMDRFVEKPDYTTALSYVRDGHYLWNSGIFIFTARTILEEIDRCLPALGEGLRELRSAIDTEKYSMVLDRVYDRLESISIDYGVMERTARPVEVFRADFGWSDVGSWQALYELRNLEHDSHGNLLAGDVQSFDSRNNLVYADGGRLVALLGVDDLMIIDTPDAILVARRDQSQEVKRFPTALKRMGRSEV